MELADFGRGSGLTHSKMYRFKLYITLIIYYVAKCYLCIHVLVLEGFCTTFTGSRCFYLQVVWGCHVGCFFCTCMWLSLRYVWVEIRKPTAEEVAPHLKLKGSG